MNSLEQNLCDSRRVEESQSVQLLIQAVAAGGLVVAEVSCRVMRGLEPVAAVAEVPPTCGISASIIHVAGLRTRAEALVDALEVHQSSENEGRE